MINGKSKLDRWGAALQGSMARCVFWPGALLPFKLVWLGIGLALLRWSPLRHFHPALQTEQGLNLTGKPMDSTLNAIVFYRRVFEPVLSKLVADCVKSGDVCLDAGANVGYFSLLMARHAGPSGQVIAIEAAPRNVTRIHRNLGANGLDAREGQVTVLPMACSDHCGSTAFFVNRLNDMHCRLTLPRPHEADYWLMGGPRAWRSISVPAITLESALGAAAGKVSFIKLDVEGSEHLLVHEIVRRCVHPELKVALEIKAPHGRASLECFEAAGFHLYDLHNNYLWLFSARPHKPTPMHYQQAYRRRHMMDVLVTRQPLHASCMC